jgi:hypothetical protein
MVQELEDGTCYVALTHDHLDAKLMMDRVRSPKAGAIVLFAGISMSFMINIPLTFRRDHS